MRRTSLIVSAILAALSMAGIAVLFVTMPPGYGAQDLGHAIAIMVLFAILDVAIIGLLLTPILRWWLAGGARTTGRVLGALGIAAGVAIGVVVVFFYSCQAMIGLR